MIGMIISQMIDTYGLFPISPTIEGNGTQSNDRISGSTIPPIVRNIPELSIRGF